MSDLDERAAAMRAALRTASDWSVCAHTGDAQADEAAMLASALRVVVAADDASMVEVYSGADLLCRDTRDVLAAAVAGPV